jgi:steroid delta-isomerase-like uncharacterized protein
MPAKKKTARIATAVKARKTHRRKSVGKKASLMKNRRTAAPRPLKVVRKGSSLIEAAKRFFDACETGKGWEGCKPYCAPNASFSAQAGALASVKTLQAYADWMKGMFTPFPNATYEVKSFAVDDQRRNVTAYGVFSASHTGPGGPVPASGKSMKTDYVYVMQFKDDKIVHMTKIWNDAEALKQIDWA